jgi:hypothetical protein
MHMSIQGESDENYGPWTCGICTPVLLVFLSVGQSLIKSKMVFTYNFVQCFTVICRCIVRTFS